MVDLFHEGVEFALDRLVTAAQGLGDEAEIPRNLLALGVPREKFLQIVLMLMKHRRDSTDIAHHRFLERLEEGIR